MVCYQPTSFATPALECATKIDKDLIDRIGSYEPPFSYIVSEQSVDDCRSHKALGPFLDLKPETLA